MSDLDDLRVAAADKLDFQAHRAASFQTYYDNEAGIIATLSTEQRREFRNLLEESAANFCELVVSAVAERLKVVGFRFGSDADNELAWQLWQANKMDADSELLHTDALVMGSSFLLVQPDPDSGVGVSITVESAMQACVLYEAGNRRKRVAGYKRFADHWGGHATEVLITPDEIVTWHPDGTAPEIARNPAGVVGLVEVAPQPRTLKPPRSELESVATIQDRINTTLWNRLVATDYAAFRQIWASGVKLNRSVVKTDDGESVRYTSPFETGADRLLIAENPDARFGSIPESTLRGYLDSVEQDVNMISAISQTPPHYFLGRVVNLAADAIRAAETGLVAKIGRRALHIGEADEEAMRIALSLVGSPAAANLAAEVVWADFETRSLGQLTDSLVKMRTLGVPVEVLWERYGATPQEIDRWRELRAAELEDPEPPAPEPSPPTPGRLTGR